MFGAQCNLVANKIDWQSFHHAGDGRISPSNQR
jgi:hypothetical protein